VALYLLKREEEKLRLGTSETLRPARHIPCGCSCLHSRGHYHEYRRHAAAVRLAATTLSPHRRWHLPPRSPPPWSHLYGPPARPPWPTRPRSGRRHHRPPRSPVALASSPAARGRGMRPAGEEGLVTARVGLELSSQMCPPAAALWEHCAGSANRGSSRLAWLLHVCHRQRGGSTSIAPPSERRTNLRAAVGPCDRALRGLVRSMRW
jgi:hypothetical protein